MACFLSQSRITEDSVCPVICVRRWFENTHTYTYIHAMKRSYPALGFLDFPPSGCLYHPLLSPTSLFRGLSGCSNMALGFTVLVLFAASARRESEDYICLLFCQSLKPIPKYFWQVYFPPCWKPLIFVHYK